MNSKQLNILLADDDIDDCSFFKEALSELHLHTSLTAVHDGEQLMRYLRNETNSMPHILFLDLNMPRKNGFECLEEIKLNDRIKQMPVIIFSTSFEQSVVNLLYESGARYFIRKPPEFLRFKIIIKQSFHLIANSDGSQPAREDFVIKAADRLII